MRMPDNGNLALTAARRRLAFAVALSAAVGGTLVFAVMPPLLPAMAADFGGGSVGEFNAQIALTMASFGWLVCSPLSGWMLGRLGIRAAIVASVLGVGFFGSVAALFGTIAAFGATRFAAGFAAALMTTACMSLIALIYDDNARPKAIGWFTAVSSAGTLPVAVASGVVAHMSAWGWRASLMMYGVFGLGAAVLAFTGAPRQAVVAAPSASIPAERMDMGRFVPLLVLIFVLQIPMIMPVAQFPFLLATLGISDPGELSVIMGGAALLMSAASVASGHLQTRFGDWPVLVAGVLLIGAGYGAVGLATAWQVAAIGNVVALLGGALYLPQFYTLPMKFVAPAARPKAIGLAQAAIFLSASCNPFVLAPLRNAFGISGMYVAVAMIAAVGGAAGVAMLLARQRTGTLRG